VNFHVPPMGNGTRLGAFTTRRWTLSDIHVGYIYANLTTNALLEVLGTGTGLRVGFGVKG